MQGPARWMMAGSWNARYFGLMFLMWTLMMVGMMLPSAAPTILLYAAVIRKGADNGPVRRSIQAFAGGYLLAWTAFSLLATLLQWQLDTHALLTPMMISASPWLSSAILLVAGGYQWAPQKKACLARCRSPAEFIARYWRPGVRGAFGMGWRHGLFCLGCCWALMLLLFFGGVMSLAWIAAITLAVLLEKLAPFGVKGGRIGGTALIIAGGLELAAAVWH